MHMTYMEYIRQFEKQTNALSYEKGLAMAILLCRKLLPDYQAFSATQSWGDPRVLKEALECCEAAQAGEVKKEVIDPLFKTVEYGDTPEAFARSIASLPYSSVILFCAHMCLAEVHNGGFFQLFWNTTGVLVPEGIEGFSTIGMPKMVALILEAASPLGSRYPRDRNNRWDALLAASAKKPGN